MERGIFLLAGWRYKRLIWLLALVVLLWLIPGTLALAASSQPSGAIKWGNAVELVQVALSSPYAQVLDAQGDLHLAYVTPLPGNNEALNYVVVTLSGKIVQKPRVLVPSADQISDPRLIYDSTGALHCAWIIGTNNGFLAQEVTVSDPRSRVVTLYQTTGVLESLSAGADAHGRIFFTWLDQRSGVENVAFVAMRGDTLLGVSQQITHVSSQLFAPQTVVYPDGVMAVTVLDLVGYSGLWRLEVRYFAPDGAAEGQPLVIARGLRPPVGNVTQQVLFLQNPLAVQLDGQQRLHIVWATLLDLGEATVVRSGNVGRLLNQQTLADSSLSYLTPCLSTRLASNSPENSAMAPVWVTWADASNGSQIFLSRINNQGKLDMAPEQLVLGLADAFEPCVGQDSHGTLYTIWQQYDTHDGYGLFMQVQNRPHTEPFWVGWGLNRDDPLTQVAVIVLGSLFAALFPAALSAIVSPIGVALLRLGERVRVPRMIALLVGFIPCWAASTYLMQRLGGYIALTMGNSANVPLVMLPISFVLGGLSVLLGYWRRPSALKETLPCVGLLLLGAYLAAVVVSLPILYALTHVVTS